MTLFGWDASDFDWSRGPMNVGAARAAGISFFTHKATEGTGTVHVHYGEALRRARDAGIPVLGAYHVVRSGDVAAEVRHFLAYLDQETPWWRTWPDWALQVDLEKWPYDQVAPAVGVAFTAALAAAVPIRTPIVYASRTQYGDTLNGLSASVPTWNANYPVGSPGSFLGLYARAGGDGGPGWVRYSGRAPAVWQYTSSATIGTQQGCDANAFRGTLDQLKAVLRGGSTLAPVGGFMAGLNDEQQHDLWVWVASLVDPNTPKTGRPDDRFHFPPALVELNAKVDALAAKLDALGTPAPAVVDTAALTAAVQSAVSAVKGSITFGA